MTFTFNNDLQTVGTRVRTEWGTGTITAASLRRILIHLDDTGETLNVVTGTPMYNHRIEVIHEEVSV